MDTTLGRDPVDYPTTLYGLLDDLGAAVLIGWIMWLWNRPARPKPPKRSEKPAEPRDPNGEF